MRDGDMRNGYKRFAKDLWFVTLVAGAPACPCLPGAQRLPQQALPPGSKDDMKQAVHQDLTTGPRDIQDFVQFFLEEAHALLK
jgi:hypothetical protein